MPAQGATFETLDWVVLAVYFAVVAAIGISCSRRSRGRDEFFLAGRRMPVLAVAVSVLATSLSAATFVGGSQQAYTSDLTYLSSNLGGLLAVVLVAWLFLPAFYRARVTSIYELLAHAFGERARTGASAAFMSGRLLASGSRLFIVSIPFAMIAFGDTSPPALLASIAVIVVVACAYTALGGIRAVIFTDVLQAVVVVATVAVALGILADRIPVPAERVAEALRGAEDGDNLRFLDLDPDPSKPYTLCSTCART